MIYKTNHKNVIKISSESDGPYRKPGPHAVHSSALGRASTGCNRRLQDRLKIGAQLDNSECGRHACGSIVTLGQEVTGAIQRNSTCECARSAGRRSLLGGREFKFMSLCIMIESVGRGRSNHAEAQSRLAVYGAAARWCEQQAGSGVGAPDRAA